MFVCHCTHTTNLQSWDLQDYIELVCIFLSILGLGWIFLLCERRSSQLLWSRSLSSFQTEGFADIERQTALFPRPVTVLKKLRKARTTYGNMSFQIPRNSSDRPWQRVGSSFIFIRFACETQQSTNPSMWRCLQAKRETAYGEKPEAVKTHLRNMVIVPLGQQGDTRTGCLAGCLTTLNLSKTNYHSTHSDIGSNMVHPSFWLPLVPGTTKYWFLSARAGRRW